MTRDSKVVCKVYQIITTRQHKSYYSNVYYNKEITIIYILQLYDNYYSMTIHR